jgi:signal transduction histidine kinase
MRSHPRSLLTYLGLRILLPLSVIVFGLLILGVVIFQQLVASLVFDRDTELGNLTALDLRLELREYSAALRSVVADPNLRSPSAETRLAALQDIAGRRQPLYAGMALLDADRTVSAATSEDVRHCASTAVAGDLYAAQALYDVLISNVLIDPSTGKSMIAIGVSMPGEPGVAKGMLLGCVRMYGSEMVDLLASLTVGGSGYAYLVDRNGRAIYHPEAAAIGDDFSDRSYVQQVIAGQSGSTLWDSPEDERWIVDYKPIPEAGWGLIIKEPRDAAVAPARLYGVLLIGLGVMVVCVVFILLWTGVRRMAAPIGWLAEQTARLADEKEMTPATSSGIAEIDALSHAFDYMAGQIASYRSSLRRYIGLITQSQEDERRRTARELHDETVQNLLAMARRVELYQVAETDPARVAQLVELKDMIGDTLNGARRISYDLRPPILEDLGLIPALHTLIERLRGDGLNGMQATLEVSGDSTPLSPDQELVLYRVSQEALANTRKHTQATDVRMKLAFEPDAVRLDISDNGGGFSVPDSVSEMVRRGSFGLMGIQERVWSVGGQLSIQSTPGAGTRLSATLPVNNGSQSSEL